MAKYLLHGKELNIFWVLDVVYGGITIEINEGLGTALLSGTKGFQEEIPLTLVAPRSGTLSKDGAVSLAVACCRVGGVAGFCYCWTRQAEPVFKETVEKLGAAFGLWPWRLAQAWRFERADVYEHVSYLLLSFTAAVPDLYRQRAICDALFLTAWNLTSQQAADIGTIAAKFQIFAVPCLEEHARLLVSGHPFYITQRDWSVLALVLMFTPYGDGIEAIGAARQSMGLGKEAV